ncbi:hypothetical protein LZD49_20015 [Dyadobacter sp. CY261]|uniref:hypothetical protein n=1 Tax=Dyadobacter sp. CY261 TaxID=2907203 RepID=UPI001F459328|nr:hypothetical protein [Dyadobacter sp. CY261]MCF0072777.1 hypothetical protein [Dyadobacter sp. CY261]
MLLNHLGDHFAEANQTRLAARYFQKAQQAGQRTELVRQAVLLKGQLSIEILTQQDEEN